MTDLQAAIGTEQIKKLPDFVETRRSNYNYLLKNLEPVSRFLKLPIATDHSNPSWFGFLMALRPGIDPKFTRDGLVAELEGARIQTRMLFAGNLLRQPLFTEMRESGRGYRQVGALPNTDFLMNHALLVGVYPGMTKRHLDHMVGTIKRYFQGSD